MRPQRRQLTRLPHTWDSLGKNIGVGCHFLLQCMKVKSESEVAQSCLTPRDPMDCSLPGSSIHGICQARVLEWVAIAFSKKGVRILKRQHSFTASVEHPLKAQSKWSKHCKLVLWHQHMAYTPRSELSLHPHTPRLKFCWLSEGVNPISLKIMEHEIAIVKSVATILLHPRTIDIWTAGKFPLTTF